MIAGLTLAAAIIFMVGSVQPVQAQLAPTKSVIQTVGPGEKFASLSDAAAMQNPADSYTINMDPGTYLDEFAVFNAPTVINGVGVTIMTDTAPPNLKGVLTTIFPLTVNGISFIGTPYLSDNSLGSGISLANGANSSAIREQSNGANTLSLNGVTIENFQMGVLTGSDTGSIYQDVVSIINSDFINNGFPTQSANPGAFGHAIYVGDAASLVVTGTMVCGQQVGHDVKSRAAQTTVTGSTLFVGTNTGAPTGCNPGSTSLAIDMPNAGVGLADTNNIFQGANNQNGSLIRYGEEGVVFTNNSLSVTRTLFDNINAPPTTIGIDELTNCIAPVSGISTDTFTNLTLSINPPTCIAKQHGKHH